MFDIGWGELVLIGIVALIVIGPKELPGVLRAVGHWTSKIKGMASDFQGQFQEAMREAEMHDLKKQVDDLGSVASNFTNFDPLADPPRSLNSIEAQPSLPPSLPPLAEPPGSEPALPAPKKTAPKTATKAAAKPRAKPRKKSGGGA